MLAAPAAWSSDGWQPLGPPVPAPSSLPWPQVWGKVALDPDGTRFASAWSTAVGNNLGLRFFAADGTPLGPELLVNEGFTDHRQDEPMLAMDAAGNLLVCWSDRKGYDGDGMGAFGRVYDSSGMPYGPPFVVNQGTAMSQWEPMPVALPSGGWLVAFNGKDDGEAYFRRLAVDGTPLGGDVSINTYTNNAQVDAVCEVNVDGVVLAAYVDFGAYVAPFTQTNIFVRRFHADGTALDALEVLAHPELLAFDQIDPRMAVNGLSGAASRFWIVWQDGGNDGSGQGVFARLFGASGAPAGPVFQVNLTTAGDQLLPEVSCDHVGNAIVTWEDRSTGTGRILARVFDADGVPTTGELLVSAPGAGDCGRPQVRLDPSGEAAVFAWDGPGLLGNPTPAQDRDAWFAVHARPALTLTGSGATGTIDPIALDLPSGSGLFRLVLASFGTSGIALPDGRSLPLSLDVLFDHGLQNPNNGLPFFALSGVLPPSGEATAAVVIPSNPAAVGVPLHFAAITLDLTQPGLALQLRHVTRGAGFVIQ